MRGFRVLARYLVILLFAALPQLAPAQAPAQDASGVEPEAPINPKIILQTLPYGGIEVAAWTPDDRYILTANSTARSVFIWDAESGIIIDRLVLPSDNLGSAISSRRLLQIVVAADGLTATIDGEAGYLPTGQQEVEIRNLHYLVDLQLRQIAVPRSVVKRRRGGTGVDLSRQASTVIEANAVTRDSEFMAEVGKSQAALEALYEKTGGMEIEAALALLPPLPVSYDGKRILERHPDGMVITEAGKEPRVLTANRPLRFLDATLAPGGALLAMVQSELQVGADDNVTQSAIDLFNMQTGQYWPPVTLIGDYSQVQWMDEGLLLATQISSRPAGTETNLQGPPPPGVIIDTDSGEAMIMVEPRCYMTPFPDGDLLGAGLANCRINAGKDFGLARYNLDNGTWAPVGKFKLQKGAVITALTVSDSGTRIAVAATEKSGTLELSILDAATGAVINARRNETGGFVGKIKFIGDDILFLSSNGATLFWAINTDELEDTQIGSIVTNMVDSDGQTFAVGGALDDVIGRLNFTDYTVMPPLDFGNAIAGGYMLDKPVFWALSALEGLRFWNTGATLPDGQWQILLTTYFFAGQNFVAVTPEGRYDTNLPPDSKAFRWLMADAPNQSLAPQTFMRDYFSPGLTERLTSCTAAGNCGSVIKQPRPIAKLNRVLPNVKIASVVPGATPDEALVSVEITEGVDPVTGRRSGVYNPRLFRDNRFVAHWPNEPFELQDKLEDWRKLNRLVDQDDKPGDGVYHYQELVTLPSGAGTEKQIFSAYAFNDDRVKSETFDIEYTRVQMQPYQPRAFVISIGIDSYVETRLDLNYAAADARLLGEKLADIPGYKMHKLIVTGEKGGKTQVDAFVISTILAMLAGIDPDEGMKVLAEYGIDGSTLAQSTPDDIIIISFSGHGWAQKEGDFFLIPANGIWPAGKDPDVASLISSSELTMWLRFINAADIALIIDACYSGAAVDSGKFKPGPMGDSGLGQLAYDKGIRILAATQADNVALEDANLRHGLLTYSLGWDDEALANPNGLVDFDKDAKINLTEWMLYPTWRLLSLGEDKQVSGLNSNEQTGSSFAFPKRTRTAPKKIQAPSLFDFTATSPVIVKELAK